MATRSPRKAALIWGLGTFLLLIVLGGVVTVASHARDPEKAGEAVAQPAIVISMVVAMIAYFVADHRQRPR